MADATSLRSLRSLRLIPRSKRRLAELSQRQGLELARLIEQHFSDTPIHSRSAVLIDRDWSRKERKERCFTGETIRTALTPLKKWSDRISSFGLFAGNSRYVARPLC